MRAEALLRSRLPRLLDLPFDLRFVTTSMIRPRVPRGAAVPIILQVLATVGMIIPNQRWMRGAEEEVEVAKEEEADKGEVELDKEESELDKGKVELDNEVVCNMVHM